MIEKDVEEGQAIIFKKKKTVENKKNGMVIRSRFKTNVTTKTMYQNGLSISLRVLKTQNKKRIFLRDDRFD